MAVLREDRAKRGKRRTVNGVFVVLASLATGLALLALVLILGSLLINGVGALRLGLPAGSTFAR
jgi:phosphate transport system permease protein